MEDRLRECEESMLYSEFVSCAEHFLRISDSLNDGWVLKNCRGNVYLVKSMTQYLPDDNVSQSSELEDLSEDFESDHQAVADPPQTFRKWEYHIVHSLSYQVPVLYFNVWKPSGQLLSLDELWNAVDPDFKDEILKNKWFTLTQQEHPYLFKPFFQFHPCQTEDFLKCFSERKPNMLITWLSSFGQAAWLKLDPVYGKKCFFD